MSAGDPGVADFVTECRRGGTSEAEIESAEKLGLDTGLRVAHPFIDGAGQRLAVVVAPELSGTELSVDEARIRHVFMNLLTNASQYTPAGGFITLSAVPEEDGFVRFGVRDQGPGIPAEHVGRIFERFYRAPHQDTRPGAGLGLASAREIGVAHGGSIACTSTEGEGSEFYFVLPR